MLRRAVLLYGLLSATLYCVLLPLWEGFDELFHYGYVQTLANDHAVPVIGETRVSLELWKSLDYAPMSPFIQDHLGRPSTNFAEYFRFSDEQRRGLRMALETIDPALASKPSPVANYEAKQAPLTYALLAPVDLLVSRLPLPSRIFALRLVLSLASMTLAWAGMLRLGQRLGMTERMTCAATFVLFSCQMTYGTVCHVANDALLGPWLLFFLVAVMDAWDTPSPARTATSALLMAVGLLIKSSTIAFVPLVFVWRWRKAPKQLAVSLGILLAIAGPWYLRNVILYHNVMATPETTGVGLASLLQAGVALPWYDTIRTTLHSALWTGNTSFTSFSASTLNMALALLGLALVLYAIRYRRYGRLAAQENVLLAAILLYTGALAGITLSYFASSKGASTAPMPWYVQLILAPVFTACFLGLSKWNHRGGKWLAMANVLLWSYIGIIGWLVVRKDPSAGVIAALSGVLTALIGGGAVALISRSKPDPVADATQPTEKPNAS